MKKSMISVIMMAAVGMAMAAEVYPVPQRMELKPGGAKVDCEVKVVAEKLAEKGAYTIKVSEKGVVIGCADKAGEFYARLTLDQLAENGKYPCCEISDWPDVPRRGVVEGFYGPPWSVEGRVKLMSFMGRNKMNFYVYGPKDDPYHHAKWREAYPAEKLAEFKRILSAAKANYVDVCWAIHLADAFEKDDADSVAAEKKALYAKLDSLYAVGFRAFAVFFDDFGGQDWAKHARICNDIIAEFLEKKGDCARLLVCPNVYTGFGENDYCRSLGKAMSEKADIMWTGEFVCSDLPAAHAARVAKNYRRAPFTWWNWPVNDYQTPNLQLGQAYGVEKFAYAGFVSNPMQHLEASKIALFGVADMVWNSKGHDPVKCWKDGIRRMFPYAADAMIRFCDYNSDPNCSNTGIGEWYRRESEDFKAGNLAAECEKNLAAAKTLEKLLPGRNPALWSEIGYWVKTFAAQAEEGLVAAKRDKDGFVKARENRERIAQEYIAYMKSTSPEWFHGNIAKPLTGSRRLQPAIDAIGRELIGKDRALYEKCYPEPGEMLGTIEAISAKGVHLESAGVLLVMNALFEQVEAKPGDWFGIASKKPIQRVWAAFDCEAPKAGVCEASVDGGETWEPVKLEFAKENIYRGAVDAAKKYNAVRWRNAGDKPIRFKLPRFNVDI